MRRRKLLWTQVALTVTFVVFMAWPRPSRVTRENYVRVRLGMTRSEVEAILGGPPKDYSLGPTQSAGNTPDVEVSNDPKIWRRPGITSVFSGDAWKGDTAEIYVQFLPSGIAVEKCLWPRQRQEQSPIRDYGWRVRRVWRYWFAE